MTSFFKFLATIICGVLLVIALLVGFAFMALWFGPRWSAGQDAWRTADGDGEADQPIEHCSLKPEPAKS